MPMTLLGNAIAAPQHLVFIEKQEQWPKWA